MRGNLMGMPIESRSLGDLLADITQNGSEPVRHFLMLTYEFDPEQALNLMLGRELDDNSGLTARHRLTIARLHPIIVYDAAKTRDFNTLPHLLELHPWKSRMFGCHHSKACCLVTQDSAHLFLGSFNITFSGLFHNREVMEHFCWTEDGSREDGMLILEWADFLRRCYGGRVQGSERSSLNALLECLNERLSPLRGSAVRAPRLLVSGYGKSAAGRRDRPMPEQSGLLELRRIWEQWFDASAEPTSLCVVSPFFDASVTSGCAASAFRNVFPALRSLAVCTDARGVSSLSLAHFASLHPQLFVIPAETSATERAAIERRAQERHVTVPDSATLERRLHAKILLLFDGAGHGLCYAGSANFTKNAWLGRNQELGVVRPLDEEAETLWKKILKGLYAASGNRASRLPETPPDIVPPDPEDDITPDTFPDFIAFIELCRQPGSRAPVFRLNFSAESAGTPRRLLDAYEVRWGDDGPALSFDEQGVSAPLPEELWRQRLLCGRALQFQHKASGTISLFPYLYADDVIEHGAEDLLGMTSMDWLLLHQKEPSWNMTSSVVSSFEESAAAPPSPDVDRNANVVIAMQRHLQFFGGLERLLKERLEEAAHSRHPGEALKFLVTEEMRALACLLLHELNASGGRDDACLFKLAELRGVAAALFSKARTMPAFRAGPSSPFHTTALFSPLLKELDVPLRKAAQPSPLFAAYLDFMMKEHAHD